MSLYVSMLQEKLDEFIESQEKLTPIIDDIQRFKEYPDIVQEVLNKEARSLARRIEEIQAKIEEYERVNEEERARMDMTAWYFQEKDKRKRREKNEL